MKHPGLDQHGVREIPPKPMSERTWTKWHIVRERYERHQREMNALLERIAAALRGPPSSG